jgi:lactoylglutathione lyase
MTHETPQLGWILLYVNDLDRAIGFYTTACGLPLRFRHESGTYAELDTGATTLALCDRAFASTSGGIDLGDGSQPPTSSITLVVNDVGSLYNRTVKAGARSVHEPVRKPWGQTSAQVVDVDGNLIEIATPIEA